MEFDNIGSWSLPLFLLHIGKLNNKKNAYGLLFNVVITDTKLTKKQREFNITPYRVKFYYLYYCDKMLNLEGYIFEKFFTT